LNLLFSSNSQDFIEVAGQTWRIKRRAGRKRLALHVDYEGCWCLAPLNTPQALLVQFVLNQQAWWQSRLALQEVLPSFEAAQIWPYRDVGRRLTADDTPASLADWYQQQALQVLLERLAFWAQQMSLQPQGYKLRFYLSRWGSCNRRQEIQLNWALISCPDWIIDYVIVHELAHLVHFNHSKAFWQLVAAFYPEYRQADQWLRSHGYLHLQLLKRLHF